MHSGCSDVKLNTKQFLQKKRGLANKDPHGSYKTYIFVMIVFYPLAILADSADRNGEHSVEISAINVHILNDFLKHHNNTCA